MKQISIAPAVVAAIAAHSFPMAANAQSITVAPAAAVAATAIPVDNPWSLLALAIGLATAAWLVLRNRQRRALFMALCTSAIVCATLWHSPDLRAQLTGSFTNPAGETRPLLVAQIVNGGNINGFSAEDFTNDSGVALKITAIQPPNLNQCFPSGFTHLMPPGAPPASPPPLCAVGNTIAPNGTCRVNVETICRAEAAQATAGASPTTLSVPGAGLSFAAGSTGTVNVSNSGGSAALNVQATIPAGSGITISSNSCAATLPAGSSCAITLTAPAAEGPTTVSIAGSNAAATTTPVTVTGGPAPTTTLSIPATPLSFAAGSTGSVTITNSGGANALNVQASIPAGSGITVSNTTCPAALAPSANCTITLTAPSAEGPTAIGFGGSNTASTSVPVTVSATGTPTTLNIPATSVSFGAGGAGSVSITNSGSAPALNVQASIPGGSGITVSNTTCSAILAPSASCTITLTAPSAEGPTSIGFGGSNTASTSVPVTVTTAVLPATLTIPSASLSFGANGAGSVTITNSGSAPAFNVQASIPAGSGITVSNTTCAAILAPSANCTITLTAPSAEGPTNIGFGGSNAPAATAQVTVTAPVAPTAPTVPPAPVLFGAYGAGSVTITNNGTAPAFNLRAIIPVGSGITVASSTCPASLPVGASCTITLTAAGPEGPTNIGVGGSNTPATTVPVTVTTPVTPTTLNIPTAPVSFGTGGAGSVTINNGGSAPAFNVQATIPAGSGITVSNSTCAAILAPAASCTITLTAAAAEGPTDIGFGGSNTPATTVPITVTAPVVPTTLNIPTTPLSFGTGGAGSVTITNSGSAPAFNVQATIPAGSGITVSNSTCAAILAPAASCTITLTAAAAEGPTAISFGGTNTPATTVPVTVTAPVAPTTLDIPAAPVSFGTSGAGTVTITNNGSAPAFNVQATIPVGSGITVASSTCPISLAPGADCTITLTAAAAEGPTAVIFGGSNTPTTTVQVTVTVPVPTATLSIPSAPLSFAAGGSTTVLISNTGASAAFNVTATAPAGSGITVQSNTCGAALASLASCGITLTAAAAEGPTAISFGGSNTLATTVPVTVTAPVTPTTLGMSTTPVSFNTGTTGSVTITNNGGAPALDVQATIPAGSGISVSANTCGSSLAAGANCIITLTASAAEGPTPVSFAGSNTSATTVPFTVTAPSTTTTLGISASTLTIAPGGTGFVTITNTGSNAAANIGATVPGVSGLSVSGNTCGLSLPAGGTCTVTFTAGSDEGPTNVTIQGSNTDTAAVSITVSGSIDIGAYHLDGSCGVLGVLGPGFTLTAGSAPLPVGTTVTIIGSGVANIGVFSVTGGTANVSVLSATSRQVTLTSALPAGATIAFRTTLSISVAFTLNGSTTLPNGYAGTGGKPAGSVSSTLILCSAT